MIIGLTGESGAGKSTVAKLFDAFGFCVVDCDAISKTLDTDGTYIAEIEEAFGDDVIMLCGAQRRVNRKALGEKVFGKNAKKDSVKTLNSISHPIIIKKVFEKVSAANKEGKTAVIDAPLLFESGLDKICDSIVGVIAPESVRIERLCMRDGITSDMAKKRFAAQKDDAFLRANCHHIIVNDSDGEELSRRAEVVLKELSKGTDT